MGRRHEGREFAIAGMRAVAVQDGAQEMDRRDDRRAPSLSAATLNQRPCTYLITAQSPPSDSPKAAL